MDLQDIDPQLCPIIGMTDCRSVFDTVHREGALKLPSERRLALDVAALREMVNAKAPETNKRSLFGLPFRWVPTAQLLADSLTKLMSGDKLRQTIMDGHVTLASRMTEAACEKHGSKCCPPEHTNQSQQKALPV